MEIKTLYKLVVLRNEVHGTTGTGRLEGRCVYGFDVLWLVLNSRCSALVDSHACDEVPWQESGENHRRATSACLELSTTTVEQTTTT